MVVVNDGRGCSVGAPTACLWGGDAHAPTSLAVDTLTYICRHSTSRPPNPFDPAPTQLLAPGVLPCTIACGARRSYWDWTVPKQAAIMFSDNFFGGNGAEDQLWRDSFGGCVADGV